MRDTCGLLSGHILSVARHLCGCCDLHLKSTLAFISSWHVKQWFTGHYLSPTICLLIPYNFTKLVTIATSPLVCNLRLQHKFFVFLLLHSDAVNQSLNKLSVIYCWVVELVERQRVELDIRVWILVGAIIFFSLNLICYFMNVSAIKSILHKSLGTWH